MDHKTSTQLISPWMQPDSKEQGVSELKIAEHMIPSVSFPGPEVKGRSELRCVELEIFALSGICKSQKYKHCMTFMWNLKHLTSQKV